MKRCGEPHIGIADDRITARVANCRFHYIFIRRSHLERYMFDGLETLRCNFRLLDALLEFRSIEQRLGPGSYKCLFSDIATATATSPQIDPRQQRHAAGD
jgi:hypothetical protein